MKSHRTTRFRRQFESLPTEVQAAAHRAFEQFAQDPQHPVLHLKRVHTTEPVVSARITRDYRALAIREGDTFVWFWIGKHEDYERLLGRL